MPKSTGTNSQGNTWSTPGGTNSNGGTSYHYSNSNGSYYYANDNGSTYYKSSNGSSHYTPSGGKNFRLAMFLDETSSRYPLMTSTRGGAGQTFDHESNANYRGLRQKIINVLLGHLQLTRDHASKT
ncbi:hypothetical protein IV203_016176 [Nitzschia inconspicua]|uniref:Uncharacterized protein n=1 Tax=Nitzschia inconspicua TaxID=303405 RepID=A0A9K3PI03_9STRA|nr:hypothetical protein IV203_016176 [Nitzschia inconspicua]